MLRTTLRALAAILTLALLAPGTLAAQAPDAIRYTLRFPAPHTHYVEVEAVYPTGRQPAIEIYMAVWTPGLLPGARVRAQCGRRGRDG